MSQPTKSQISSVPFILGVVFALTPFASPPTALALGILLGLIFANPLTSYFKRASRPLLQCSVVLLGFSMNLPVVLEAGRTGFLFAAVSIAATFALGAAVRRLITIDRIVSVLISTGTAICGGSAIAAVGAVIGATEGEMAVSLGTVFLLNAVALYIFPIVGHLLHLSQEQFGLWAGVGIHDVSAVVGAATRYGDAALQVATAVKLSRVLWIIPVALCAGVVFSRDEGKSGTQPKRFSAAQVPWFIGFFLLASLARSFIPGIAPYSDTLTHISKTGFTLTLFLIGAGISLKTLKAVGWKPLLQGLLLWFAIVLGSLAVVLNPMHW